MHGIGNMVFVNLHDFALVGVELILIIEWATSLESPDALSKISYFRLESTRSDVKIQALLNEYKEFRV